MDSERRITLPKEPYRLEEINLPPHVAGALAGKTISVEVAPQQEAGTRQFDKADLPQALPLLMDPQGNAWNDYWPLQVSFSDPQGREMADAPALADPRGAADQGRSSL